MPDTYEELRSTFSRKPAYRYIRKTDNLPTIDAISDLNTDQILAKVKLYNPTGSGTWYIAAYDPDTKIAFGAASIYELEMGDFYMPELVEFRGQFNLPIERDLYWKPTTLDRILEEKGI